MHMYFILFAVYWFYSLYFYVFYFLVCGVFYVCTCYVLPSGVIIIIIIIAEIGGSSVKGDFRSLAAP